jgi:hypothetical protein
MQQRWHWVTVAQYSPLGMTAIAVNMAVQTVIFDVS